MGNIMIIFNSFVLSANVQECSAGGEHTGVAWGDGRVAYQAQSLMLQGYRDFISQSGPRPSVNPLQCCNWWHYTKILSIGASCFFCTEAYFVWCLVILKHNLYFRSLTPWHFGTSVLNFSMRFDMFVLKTLWSRRAMASGYLNKTTKERDFKRNCRAA